MSNQTNPNSQYLAWLIVISVALMLVAVGFVVCFSNGGSAQAALKSSGLNDGRITGWAPFGCEEGDESSTAFEARNAQGIPVKGVVCCGAKRACTVHVVP